jgi:hypothetical protein
MATSTERRRARRHVSRHEAEPATAGRLAIVRCGRVWEVRDAYGVVSWADTLDAALAEAARHERRR